MGGSRMGISKNVFLRGGVGSTLYFNQEYNYARSVLWGDSDDFSNGLTYSLFMNISGRVEESNTIIGGANMWVYIKGSDLIYRYYSTNNVTKTISGFYTYSGWIHFCFIRDFPNKAILVYVNGINKHNAVYENMTEKVKGGLIVGNFSTNSTDYFGGNMAFLKTYNRVLSDNEIKLLSKNYPISRVGLIGEWDLTEGSGSVSYDKSGRGKDLTISDCAWNSDKPF